jgi:hypothetical protein
MHKELTPKSLFRSKVGHRSTIMLVYAKKCAFRTIAFRTGLVSNGTGASDWTK